MNEHVARLTKDLQTIETSLGLDLWTRRDIRRGMIGNLVGGTAGLGLALWSFFHGSPLVGLLAFLSIAGAVLLLKDINYRRSPAPTPGTQREIGFYNRYYIVGSTVIGCYFIWGQKMGMDLPLLFG